MNIAPLLCDQLATTLVEKLRGADVGYCLRVDHLDSNDAESLCREDARTDFHTDSRGLGVEYQWWE